MDQARRTYLQRRLKRWEAMLSLWLADLLAHLEQVCGGTRKSTLRNWLDAQVKQLTHYVMGIILIHATMRLELGAAQIHYDRRRSQGVSGLRSAAGGELRRVFKAKTIKGRLEKIRWALANREALVARLARRLRMGLTRIGSVREFDPSSAGIAGSAAPFLTGLELAGPRADTS